MEIAVMGIAIAFMIEVLVLPIIEEQLLNREIRYNVYRKKIVTMKIGQLVIVGSALAMSLMQGGVL